MMRLVVEVPGKVILAGEHAAVYGYPAIVTAVNRTLNLKLEWDEVNERFYRDLLKRFEKISAVQVLEEIKRRVKVEIKSKIPVGCGMGSSAALAAAVSAATLVLAGEKLNKRKINAHAFLLEKQAHGKPSGVDNRTVIYGGANLSWVNQLIVVNTGTPSESTKKMVEKVKRVKDKDKLMKKIGEATKLMSTDIKTAIFKNEQALEKIGVVSKKTQKLIREIEKRGGVAKVSGAGGYKTNSGLILVYAPQNQAVLKLIKQSALEYFPIRIHNGIEWIIIDTIPPIRRAGVAKKRQNKRSGKEVDH